MAQFTDQDLTQINQRGSSIETVQTQLNYFIKGFPYLPLIKPASIGDGILKTSEGEKDNYKRFYEEKCRNLKVLKFVPASGAASRMFKELFAFLESYDGSEGAYQEMVQDKSFGSIYHFFKHLDDFAFYQDLKKAFESKYNEKLEEAQLKRKYKEILSVFLTEDGLNYGALPKGLLKFHNYSEGARTPFEEHLVEGANYCKNEQGEVKLHFTVSPEHLDKFKEHEAEVKAQYEAQFKTRFNISYSTQKKSTDTIAVDMANEPFRSENGKILFRPAGHGALLSNLNEVDADIIFIKNIDNVVPDQLKSTTYEYKKLLGGILLKFQDKVFQYQKSLADGTVKLQDLMTFIEKELCVLPQAGSSFSSDEEKKAFAAKVLNRPIRICGMVKNVGETGGGPFWAQSSDGTTSLQVVETAQINLENESQKNIMTQSTHFNPVDVVCTTKNFKGEKFDLMQFRDHETGFITKKSKDGRDLKAQELPGLWNGSMAYWNTLFVEVPAITFNPVKTVNDLLRDEHK